MDPFDDDSVVFDGLLLDVRAPLDEAAVRRVPLLLALRVPLPPLALRVPLPLLALPPLPLRELLAVLALRVLVRPLAALLLVVFWLVCLRGF